ncbi:ATP-binding protein [Mucilaginibacter sp. 5C4]|uniref:ATP-binding protein n=1 Tax=Mucilaginibacter sp. 5C4 TaxID=3048589 RepID=UPI002AC8C9BA|nr:ATP-binding protein [Mucilaginibacter sp. 5C4]MEB0301534.1 ATP-binding protein [Mucilaginibacter sp. 5C4]WPX25341.1 ATP-binding protein [Mucilaginibacter sp. 5C4]
MCFTINQAVLILNIDSSKLTDSPYTVDRKKSFLIEDNEAIDQITLELKHAAPSSFLISGYRGVGKTSFVNRIAENLSSEFVCVNINLAKYDGYSTLIKKLIRELYIQFETFNIDKTLSDKDQLLNTEFKLLYDRTFNDIVNSHIVNSKKERKIATDLDLNLKKLIPIILIFVSATNLSFDWLSSQILGYLFFIASLIWACITSFKLTWSNAKNDSTTNELSRKSLYDDGIAEHHLLNILQKLQKQGFKVLIAFDEIDKIQDIQDVKGIISDLKFLLLSGYANFFVIAGQALYYEFEKSGYEDDQVISTLFSKNLHVPFLKFATLKKYCFGLMSDESQKSDHLANIYFDTIISASSRVPRKLVNLIRANLLWKEKQAYLNIEEGDERRLQKESEMGELLAKIMDSKLPDIAKNKVQLDFFIAQIYLWIVKMKEYNDGRFLMSTIMDIPSYKDKYPETYIAQLIPLKVLLIEEMLEQNIIQEKRSDDHEVESSYSWTPDTIESSSESGEDGLPGHDDPDQGGPDDSTNGRPIAPSFVTDFAEFEAFLREIYIEFVPEDTKRKHAFPQLVNRLIDIGILTKTWYSSTKIKELIATKNKVVHGEAVGPEDLNVIQASVFTLSRLKSEVIEDLTFYVSQRYLQSFNVARNKGGYDFTATRDNDVILFEVKYIQAGQPDTRSINEIFDKYSNYALGSSLDIYYVLFFFQPNRRKSFDDFYIKFNDTLNAEHPELKAKLNVFYISENNDKGLKNTIEDYLKEVLVKIGPRQNQPMSYFNEFELETTESTIKEKSLKDWPDNYEMQASVIQNQQKALESLKRLDANGLGEDIFKVIKEKAKTEWPNDFEMQLNTFQTQTQASQTLSELKPDNLSEAQFSTIMKNAKTSWPDNYEMQLHEFETQKESVVALAGPKPDDITEEEFKRISDKARREYPHNYEMQLHERKNQIEGLRKLK